MDNTEVIRRAATAMKALRLAATPGMDLVCLKLNMEPTYDELKTAKAWFTAFEKARDSEKRILEIAEEINYGR